MYNVSVQEIVKTVLYSDIPLLILLFFILLIFGNMRWKYLITGVICNSRHRLSKTSCLENRLRMNLLVHLLVHLLVSHRHINTVIISCAHRQYKKLQRPEAKRPYLRPLMFLLFLIWMFKVASVIFKFPRNAYLSKDKISIYNKTSSTCVHRLFWRCFKCIHKSLELRPRSRAAIGKKYCYIYLQGNL